MVRLKMGSYWKQTFQKFEQHNHNRFVYLTSLVLNYIIARPFERKKVIKRSRYLHRWSAEFFVYKLAR